MIMTRENRNHLRLEIDIEVELFGQRHAVFADDDRHVGSVGTDSGYVVEEPNVLLEPGLGITLNN